MSALPRFRWQRKRLATALDTPTETLIELGRADLNDTATWAAIARHRNMPWVRLAALTKELSPSMHGWVGRNLDGPRAVSIAMSDDPLAKAIEETGHAPGVARDEKTLGALFSLFIEQRSDPVRHAVATNRMTPGEVLERLARDPAVRVRIDVARNPSTPPSALSELALNLAKPLYDDGVRREVSDQNVLKLWALVAQHPSTPERALRELAADGFERTVAANPSAPSNLLTELADDHLAIFDPDTAKQPLESWSLLPLIAKNPMVAQPVLHRLAEARLGRFVVQNPNAASTVLAYIVEVGPWAPDIFEDVSRHPNADDATLKAIMTHRYAHHAAQVAAEELQRREQQGRS